MSEQVYHIPALLDETLAGLSITPSGTYVDVTLGGGGHSRAILAALGSEGRLYGFDQDLEAEGRLISDPRFTFVHSNFAYLRNFLRYHGVDQVDGILADLGVSFHHFDAAERGFSFRSEGRLDMRMNRDASRDAASYLAEVEEGELADALYLYGELKQSRRLAAAIVKARAQAPIESTLRLVEVVSPLINRRQEKKELAQVFQALRIVVNREMDALRSLLEQSLAVLKPGGRLAVIAYHSLEDRMVKNFMRSGDVEGKVEKDFYGRVNSPWEAVNNKVITASDEEVARNPRSRSARLRIARKIAPAEGMADDLADDIKQQLKNN
ncbi:MAG: 16S rRNA (cytosine(1402)-N(4))-methyltransferase RsmH [Muribaculaceae bacterium]|nr:16S rRNA (cytosine(1402)-N(4))-methyltransferase RsmH [Muribaculaceae bacterium]